MVYKIKKEIIFAIGSYILLFILCFMFSVFLGLGEAESQHSPASLWLYARRVGMIIFGLIIPWFRQKDNFAAFGWKAETKWIFITVGVGLFIGLGNKGGFDPVSPVAIMLALFHAFATELFFRRYLLTTLSQSFNSMWPPILISSFMYGFFYLTVWTTWGLPLGGKIIFVLLFTALGILFSYSYKKSGCFLVPWIMHFLGVLNYRLIF